MIENIKFENLGTVNKNQVRVDANGKSYFLYFSYQTLVGIEWGWGCKYVIQNYWSVTTGKLLNQLEPDKKKRLNSDDFNAKVNQMFLEINKVDIIGEFRA